jgi:hypothetical protein
MRLKLRLVNAMQVGFLELEAHYEPARRVVGDHGLCLKKDNSVY